MANKVGKWRVWARQIAYEAVRNNTILEELHAGKMLPKKYLGYEYSRITEKEMRELMLAVEENIKNCLWVYFGVKKSKEKEFLRAIRNAHFGEYGISWDIPKKKYKELLDHASTN